VFIIVPAGRIDDPASPPPVGGGFVGRGRVLDRIGALVMGPARLVTLIGSGGIGKTTLAEEAVRRVHTAQRSPVFRVRLARLSAGADAAAVKEAITGAVLVGGFAGDSAWDGVLAALSRTDASSRAADTLLLLDNCEHLLGGAGLVIAELLDVVARLTIVATSREPVGWIDEQLVAVRPLSATQSLALFRRRAELTGHLITEPAQLAVARQICRHLHGNPLYIRLAAARMFYEPLPMILEQLTGESDDVRMQWRPRTRLGAEERHRSIGDVIAWSYQLCGDKQRLLFDRLSAFAPGYEIASESAGARVADVGAELEAIEAVCADDVSIEGCDDAPSGTRPDRGRNTDGLVRNEIRELLERLVDQSLVSIHITSDTPRYFLLESLRLFASQRLAQRSSGQLDEPARLARRHCCYYRNKVTHAYAEWFGPAQPELLNWAFGAWSNIVRAIDTGLHTAGQAVVGLQIARLLGSPPLLAGSLSEIRAHMERALAATQRSEPQPTEFRREALAKIAFVAVFQGRPHDAEDYLRRCIGACEMPESHWRDWRDRPDTDLGGPAALDYAWGVELMFARRDPRAIAVLGRAREKFRGIADRGGEAMSGMHEALAAGFYGSPEQAMMVTHYHLEQATTAGAPWAQSWAQLTVAVALIKHGDAEQALHLSRAALADLLRMGDAWTANWAVHAGMWSLARQLTDRLAGGNSRRAALVELATEIAYLAGGLRIQRARLGIAIENLGPFADETHTAEAIARQVLGDQIYVGAENRGSRLSPARSELQRLVLGTLSIDTVPVEDRATAGSLQWQTLSKTEQEVAVLAAAGWPNSAIAVRRGTSTRTTDAQMSSIFQKLTVSSREEIVGVIPQDQRHRVLAERAHKPLQSRRKPQSLQSRPHG
jgi:DNA-binding CsgD family transcriptional regulator